MEDCLFSHFSELHLVSGNFPKTA